MNSRNDENLKGLFGRFLDAEKVDKSVEDVRRGEQILREHPVSEPDGEFIAEIKAEVAGALLHRRKVRALKRLVCRTAAVAAAVIILAAIGVRLFERDTGPARSVSVLHSTTKDETAEGLPEAVWEGERLAAEDEDLAVLTAEIEQLEDELLAVQLGEDGGNGNKDIVELEAEFIEISSDFWKG